jgi:hypothetical protein
VVNPTAYGGVQLTGITTGNAALTTIDPPFRARCAAQVHLWIATPAGVGSETGPGNVKLPASVNSQGASAYVARVNAGPAGSSVVIVSQYVAPKMVNATDHRCAFAEAYSVTGAQPFQAKQRPGLAFDPLTWSQVAQRNLIIVGPNTPFFLVPYALTNDGSQPAQSELSLEQAEWHDLPALRPLTPRRRVGRLNVTGAGFIDFPCGTLVSRDEVDLAPDLSTELTPGEQRVIGVLVDVATEPATDRLDVAVLHVRERRSDGFEGGITIIAASNPDMIGTMLLAEEPDACPIDLIDRPTWVSAGNDLQDRGQPSVPPYSVGHLVVDVNNTSSAPIDDLELWLESHAVVGARIDPVVIQSVRLDPGEALRAAWPISLDAPPAGDYAVSFVASSPRHAPHRLVSAIATRSSGADDARGG